MSLKMLFDFMKVRKCKRFLLWLDRILAHGLRRQAMLLVLLMVVMFFTSFALLSISGSLSPSVPSQVEASPGEGNVQGWIKYCEDNNISRWALPFYLLIVPDAFYSFCTDGHISMLQVAIACIIYIVGVILFTGMIISVMTNVIERRVENHKHGYIHYLLSGHYVIMGYDSMVSSFINYIFRTDPEAYVLVLTSSDVRTVRRALGKSLALDKDKKDKMERIIVNYGDRTDSKHFPLIHLESAKQIFIVGNREHPAHDALNVECVDGICLYLETVRKKGGNKSQGPTNITCVFNDLDTYKAFKTTEIFGRVSALGMDFFPYNFYTEWAKQVFVDQYHVDMGEPERRYRYPAVYGNGITPDDPKYVHLVFVGSTNIAEAFAMEAAQILHFPNFSRNQELKTRITFIDINADKWMTEFLTRYRRFFEIQSYQFVDLTCPNKNTQGRIVPTYDVGFTDFLDVDFEIIKGDIFSQEVQNMIRDWALEKDKQYLSLFLTMEKQVSNFILGMNMPDEVYENGIPLFIRQELTDNFVTDLREEEARKYRKDKEGAPTDRQKDYLHYTINAPEGKETKGRYANIYPFGMNETVYDTKQLKRAKLVNYLYKKAEENSRKEGKKYELPHQSDLDATENLWELIDAFWRELPSSLKWSNLYNAYTIPLKQAALRSMRNLDPSDGSRDLDPLIKQEAEEIAKVEHNRWNVEKLLMGYRRPSPEEDFYVSNIESFKKNKDLFIHHDIRPFDKLGKVKEVDKQFALYIPWILKVTEEADNWN